MFASIPWCKISPDNESTNNFFSRTFSLCSSSLSFSDILSLSLSRVKAFVCFSITFSCLPYWASILRSSSEAWPPSRDFTWVFPLKFWGTNNVPASSREPSFIFKLPITFSRLVEDITEASDGVLECLFVVSCATIGLTAPLYGSYGIKRGFL